MSRRDPATALGDLIGRLPNVNPPGSVERAPISPRVWEQAVGTRIAQKTRPYRIERGVLHVRVAHSVWANELGLLSDEIRARLAEQGIEVESLRFSVGRVVVEKSPARARNAPRAAPLPRDLQRAVDGIEDDDLRAALSRAASLSLGERKRR